MSNTVIVYDILLATRKITQEIEAMLRKANLENRDITDDELRKLKSERTILEDEILSK